MSKTIKNQSKMNNSSQTLNQKPFDILMNEHFGTFQKNGTNKNWFIPIVKEQSMMDKILTIQSSETEEFEISWELNKIIPKTLIECTKDENGNITSIYVLYNKGGKLYKVVSQKDYGIIKSRMELKNNKFIPYEKCDLVPYTGTVLEYNNDDILVKSFSYKNGLKEGECFTYFYDKRYFYHSTHNNSKFEKTTYKNGKKNGEYLNKKNNEKGTYFNDKKIGEWRIKGKQLINDIHSSYQSNYDLNEHNVEIFTSEQLPFNLNSNISYPVYYVNDILNGGFEIEGWKGEFHLGLINGQISKDESRYNSNEKYTVNYIDGLKEGFEINYSYNDYYEENESNIKISKYTNGKVITSTTFSTNKSDNIPQVLTSLTTNYLNEDVFYTLIKNNMNLEKFSLEKFLTNWVVLENIDYNIDNSIINKISIEHQNMVYPLGYRFRLDEYLVDECGYPYYNEEEYSKCQYLRIEKSDEFRYPSDYHPKVFSVNEFGKPKQLLINGILVNEKIDEVTNPIVLEYQKEQFQKLSDDMKLSYENELKMRKDEERLKEERVQKLNEEKGFSVNSFPID